MADQPRRKIKQFEVMVAETIRETPDTATLILFTGNDRLEYKPGHFVTIDPHQFPALERWVGSLEDTKGKRELARAYSLFSSPHEKYLAITVKEERYISGQTRFPPLLSPLLVYRVQPGSLLTVTGFTGPYVMPDDVEDRTNHLVHICAGSGAVPNLSIIKFALATNMKLKHTLICGNKTWEDVIYRYQLRELQQKYPDQLQVIHCLTREDDPTARDPSGVRGRVSEEVIRRHVPDPTAAEFFVCGPGITKFDRQAAKENGIDPPPRFLESVIGILDKMGVGKHQIHHESYG